MAAQDHNISADYHPEGSDARPRDTLDRDSGTKAAPSTTPAGHGVATPVVDEKGRPLAGDGTTAQDRPVTRPSDAEQIPPR